MERIHPNPPKLEMDFTDEGLTGCAGLAFLAHSAKRCGLFRQLSDFAPCKVRRRGASDAENLWSLVSLLAQGCGTLRDLDGLKSDTATCGILGLDRVSGSRRVGEWLHRMDASHVTSLRRISRLVAAQVAPAVISHEVATRGYVPVFLDGTAIEVDGDHFEGDAEKCRAPGEGSGRYAPLRLHRGMKLTKVGHFSLTKVGHLKLTLTPGHGSVGTAG